MREPGAVLWFFGFRILGILLLPSSGIGDLEIRGGFIHRADTLIRDSLCYNSRNWLALIIFMENQETAAISLIGTVPRRI